MDQLLEQELHRRAARFEQSGELLPDTGRNAPALQPPPNGSVVDAETRRKLGFPAGPKERFTCGDEKLAVGRHIKFRGRASAAPL